ncbi:MAG: transcription antitermination factor NusB [Planctomycetota bacterium]|nr:transcription antitermination factor NusB [Planctomycetota bacterium]
MTTARELVTKRIARRARQFPDLKLTALETTGLDGRDAALAAAIDHAVARRWLTLAAVLGRFLNRPWDRVESSLQATLLVGAAQLLLMDRVPDHAAINEAVELAKRMVRSKAGGLVNAVLHRVADLRAEMLDETGGLPAAPDRMPLHDGRAWRFTQPVFDEDPLRRLGQQTSHPEHLLRRWREAFGWEQTCLLAAHGLVHPPIIIANLEGDDPRCRPHERRGFHVYAGPRDALDDLLAEHVHARVQDPASAAAIGATADRRPRLIIDLCAGQGTKTAQLAHHHPEARIIATETDARRLEVLERTFAQHERVEVVEPHALRPAFDGRADLLLLDVPCSNTAVLARRVEARYRFGAAGLGALVDLQRQIVADAIPLLAPASVDSGGASGGPSVGGGRVLYVTCSLEEEENEGQARWIARWHRMQIVQSERTLPAGGPGDDPASYTDGGFFALLGPHGP